MHGKELTVTDFLNVAIRRKWLILVCVLVAAVGAWGVCLVWPKSYRSTTTIFVESQKIPETYVKGVVSGTIQERLVSVRQILLSRQLLKQVAQDSGMIAPESDQKIADGIVAKMTKAIVIDIPKEQTAFQLSFTHSNPQIARAVTARLAGLVVEENIKRREQLVEGATEFLHQELRLAKEELEGKEKAISEFKRQHMGELPQQVEANLRALDRLQSEMSTTAETINGLNSRLDGVEKAIREYQAGDINTSLPLTTQRKIDPRVERLHDLEQRLAALSAEYKDSYPDIVHLKEEIRKLRAAPSVAQDSPEHETSSGVKKTADPYLTELVRQRNEIKNELAVLKQKQTRIAAQIVEYEGRVERTPSREQQLMILVRDYENLQKNYQSLLDKKLSASISENLERRQKGEQFRIIDPANLPLVPETPNELLIMLAGLAMGCGLGYGAAFWLEYGRGFVRTPDDAESIAGFPLLATIPDFATAYKKGFPRVQPTSPERGYFSGVKSRFPQLSASREMASGSRGTNGGALSVLSGEYPYDTPKKEEIGNLRLELNLVAKWRPYSLVAEQYRVAATKLVMSSSDLKSAVIVVTSAIKGEGKSSSVSNLGYVLAADLGKRTLLIDCDFKHPSLHLYCGLSSSPGLIEVLSGKCAVSEALQRVGDAGPWILPSGSRERAMVELAQIPKLKTVIAELRDRFDYILLDAPPILPLADMNLLSALADFVVFVVRVDVTQKSAVETAVKSLGSPERAGVIVTGYSAINVPKYMQDYYFAGHGKERT